MPTTSPSLSDLAGFSLLGVLLLVLATTAAGAFITAMIVPMASNRQAHETLLKGKALRLAIDAYKANHGAGPGALAALVTNDNNPATCTFDNVPASPTYLTLRGWCGPYLDQAIVENAADFARDGWASAFQYDSGTTALSSCGPNRVCGDADDVSF